MCVSLTNKRRLFRVLTNEPPRIARSWERDFMGEKDQYITFLPPTYSVSTPCGAMSTPRYL